MAGTGRRVRTDFTTDEDILLVKFIATYNPTKQNRSGNTLYKRLVENASFSHVDGKWNWSKTHPWPSWRDRYVKNADEFDRKIARYQKKKGINSEKQPSREPVFSPSDEEEEAARVHSKETSKGKKRAGVQVSSEQRKAKRAKLDRDQPDSEKTEETSQVPVAGTSDQARSPVQGPSETVSDVLPPPKFASTLNIPLLPSRGDTLPVLSSQPNSPARTQPPISSQLPPSSQPPASSSQQVATPKPPSGPKRVLKHKSVSPVFRSLSPTPNHSTPLKKKILPKVVEGHFTTSLTDRLGHVRPGGRSEGEEVWPPVRGKKGKEREAAPGPTALIPSAPREQERHPINGVVSRTLQPAVVPKRESEDQHPSALLVQHRPEREHHPFRQVPLPLPSPRNRSGADAAESPLKHRSTNGEGQLVGSSRDRQRDNVTGPSTSGLPPVPPTVQPAAGPSRLTTAAVPSGLTSSAELPHGQPVAVPSAPPRSDENTRLLNAPSLAQIPTGSASSSTATIQQTRVPLPISNSPFLPSNKDKGKGKQRDAEPPVTHAQRLLTRIQKQHRRQTVGGYEHDDPSIDLVRLRSATSTSRIPRSRGRTSASHIPHRHTFSAHSTPSTVPVNLPGYLVTPGPAIPPVPLALMTPADLSICASIGLDAALSHIAAAQGYTIEVVRNVYNRVGNLKDTEEYVKGMREASEGWIGNKLEQRDREARRARRVSSGRENGRESSESNDSDEAPRGFHGSSLRQAPPEQPTPNGLQVQHDPRLYEVGYQPHPTTKAALHNRALMGGGGRLSASRKASAIRRYRRKKDEVAEVDVAVDTNEDDDGEVASGEEDEEANADVERAEEESVVEKLFPESPLKGLQDQDAVESHPEQDAGNEPELASDDAEQLDLDDHHHEFSQAHARFHATHVKRESLTPPPMYRPHGDPEHVPAQNGEDVLNGALSDVHSTRSVSLPRDVDEGKTLLSGTWHMRQMLEKQWGKGSMRKRVTQLLR
ncbi:uncharacterized protein EDB91DRAFT_1252242 [Suillus paluster]|uniref:uncharacterized protein n=1 Tax=Suillus paluster TaxID=48578 RepID=UPI001B86B3E6|nr:uncharacterized protein EDB91DRAFT_1252242 [Suillus paluster]KAG1731177.1 hypothetical protein EDB91DRAFT_1252242 [Suillus paluster]